MNFLKIMHELHDQLEKWMYNHPWRTVIYVFAYITITIACWHFVSEWLTVFLFATYAAGTVFIMACDILYYIKSNYQPPRCETCGQVLPEERQ